MLREPLVIFMQLPHSALVCESVSKHSAFNVVGLIMLDFEEDTAVSIFSVCLIMMEPHILSLWQSIPALIKEKAKPDASNIAVVSGGYEMFVRVDASERRFIPAISVRQDWHLPRSLWRLNVAVIIARWLASVPVSKSDTAQKRS